MGKIGTAFRAFFVALFDSQRATQIESALTGGVLPKLNLDDNRQPAAKPATLAASPPKRSEAVTLLAALQREARLIDLIQEPLDKYSDEQIGAAARNVLRDAAGVVQRFFELRPVLTQDEQAAVDIAAGYDPARFRLTGKVEGNGPFRGTLAHKGWQATKVNLPAWTGSQEAALVVAPAEVEI